uniref:Rho-GAP domain-containing protein n=1 Tax=Suricata suricatta TaxID=37032 RepID=A0A673SMG5_SURSU
MLKKIHIYFRPFTEGIFRKSANMKSCRILKEKLNSGDKVNLDSESVLVVASVLKDFLQNIQGSVFSSDLYDKWLGVADQENEEEKVTAAQRLLDQLPRVNVVLLRYLFGVLYNIEQHSSLNKMTAYNLSVCIAPSILCSSNSCSSELESNLIKKISVVQFLIENCLQIFGEDISSLLGESSPSCDSSNNAAGTVNNLIGFVRSRQQGCQGSWEMLDGAVLAPRAHPQGNDFHLLLLLKAGSQVKGGLTLL